MTFLQGSGASKNWAELLRRHNGERLKLERELLKEEQEAIAQLVEEEENKRKHTVGNMADTLVSNLHGKDITYLFLLAIKGSIILKNRNFIIQERFNKFIHSINTIIKCDT